MRKYEQSLKSDGIRVCRLVADYPVGGIPTYGLQPNYYYLSKQQIEMGYDVQVVAHRKPGQPQHEVCDGVEIHRVETPFALGAFKTLQRLLSETKRKVIHTHATAGYFLAFSRNLLPAPLVSHIHGATFSAYFPAPLKFGEMTLDYSRRSVYSALIRERLLWRSADRLLAVSSSLRKDLITSYNMPAEKISVVYNGIDERIFRPVDGSPLKRTLGLEGKRVVLFVGHFGLRKGLLHLIKAMQFVAAKEKDSMLVCIGGPPSWRNDDEHAGVITSFIEKAGLKGKVILLNKVPNSQLPAYYALADIFVLPSFYEAFAKVIIEAMACERPVVATRLGGNLDAIEDGRTGLLAEYGNARDFADCILSILGDNKTAESMGKKGRERVVENFTWKAVAERIGPIYDQLLSVEHAPRV